MATACSRTDGEPTGASPGSRDPNLLPRRFQLAQTHYRCCLLCEHRCAVDRQNGERGHCKAGPQARLFRHRVEYGEEPELVPSHLFYLAGCDLRCAFCIAEENAFDPRRGRVLSGSLLWSAIQWGRKLGARNLQWVGGEPTIHIPAVLEAMAACPQLPPIVWKSDFYATPEAFALLQGVVDVYVADFKFGNDHCARELAGVDDYVGIITRNLVVAASQAELIVRHLLLPGHIDCCLRPIVEWLSAHLPGVRFSLRDGYLPRWRARRDPQLGRYLSTEEIRRATELARRYGLSVVT